MESVKLTVFEEKANVISVLNFCTKDASEDTKVRLNALPLCYLADGSLQVFSLEHKPFNTNSVSFLKERNIFLLIKIFTNA